MPANKSAYIRYRIIDACLNNTKRPYPNKRAIADKIYEQLGLSISESMIEKDIREMKKDPPEGFAAPIEFNRMRGGYYYAESNFTIQALRLTDEEWEGLRYASGLLFQYADVPIFSYFKDAIEKIDLRFGLGLDPSDPDIERYVQFEQPSSHSGYQWLADVYTSIRNRFLLSMTYENIYKNEVKSYLVQPCLLRENRNSWYVIGWVEERNDYLTFALDRIKSLQVIEQKQKRRQDFDASTFLKDSVGVMENPERPSKIHLLISSPFDRLIELNPVHHSQKITRQKKGKIEIALTVLINEELFLRLMSLGPYCQVLKPASLVQKMQEWLQKSLDQYR